MELKIPSLNVEHEIACIELDKLEDQVVEGESASEAEIVADEISDEVVASELGVSVEDLDGESKNIFKKIAKWGKNLIEDIKSFKENFEGLSLNEVKKLTERINGLSGSYSKPEAITSDAIKSTLAVYNKLKVVSGFTASDYIEYANWAKDMALDDQLPKGIHDFTAAFFSNDSAYEVKGKSTAALDKIKDKEIRDWLHKDTMFGIVARIAGPNTYTVIMHKEGRFNALLSKGGLVFGGACLRTDNYSAGKDFSIPVLSESDYKKLVEFLKKEAQGMEKLIKDLKDMMISMDGDSAVKSVVKAGGTAMFNSSNLAGMISKLRTAQKAYHDFAISYVKYLSALTAICEQHSA